jgi:hypothetical protein
MSYYVREIKNLLQVILEPYKQALKSATVCGYVAMQSHYYTSRVYCLGGNHNSVLPGKQDEALELTLLHRPALTAL